MSSDGPADSPRSVLCAVLAHPGHDIVEALDRIPAAALEDPSWSFAVVVDATGGGADSRARGWIAARGVGRWTVLRSPMELGPGGMRKLAFHLAAERRASRVLLLPVDGCSVPEGLLPLAQALEAGADVAVVTPGRAAHATRPGLGARLVRTVLSGVAGRSLPDPDAGPRGYALAFVEASGYVVSSNGERFDTEILLQAVYSGARLAEVPAAAPAAPRRRLTLSSTVAHLRAAARYRLHCWGTFCALQYRGLARVVYRDKGDALYTSHAAALEVVRRIRPERLLDLGCGPGFVAERCERLGIRVTGVDGRPPLPGRMTEFRQADLDGASLPLDVFEFPVVLFLDVVEHLSSPEEFLLRLRNGSRALVPGRPRPTLVLTTPNVAFAAVRLSLLIGRFNYAERGILDIDHRRLFTRSTLVRTLRDCGYEIRTVRPVAAPFEVVVGGPAGRALGLLAHVLARIWPSMFAFQFLVECTPLPGLRAILEDAGAAGRPRADD